MGKAGVRRRRLRNPCWRCDARRQTMLYVVRGGEQRFLCWDCVRQLREYMTVMTPTRWREQAPADAPALGAGERE